MKYEGKLAFLGKHYKIAGFDKMTLNQKADAIKKASGKPSVTEAFDAAKGNTVSKVATEEPKTGEIIPPGTVSQIDHKVDVAAPNIVVNIPSPGINVHTGNLSLGHVVRQSVLWLNGFGFGAMAVALIFLARMA